jgi:hypothetical protein
MSKKESLLSFDHASRCFDYQPESGQLIWKVSTCKSKAGSVAGYVNSNGYMVVGLLGEKYRLHRLAWLLMHGHWPVGTIDHINCDRGDNRLCNLRNVSQAVNMQNKREPTISNTSGYLGVYWSARRGGFMASVSVGNRKQKRRGPYRTPERAFDAYVDLKRMHHEGCTL